MIFLLTANGFFSHLLKTFDNLGLDQALQLLGPDLDPNCLLLWWYSTNEILYQKYTTKEHATVISWMFSIDMIEEIKYFS